MQKQLKILVTGDVEGEFDQLFARINTIQRKAGQFDMLLCVGEFFGENNQQWEQYKSGAKPVPIPTFILGTSQPDHLMHFPDDNGCEIITNVTYLGKKGVYTGSSGLQLAYLSGMDSSLSADTTHSKTHFSTDELDALRLPLVSKSSFSGLDILLTSQWPCGVEKYASNVDDFDSLASGSARVAQLAVSLRPRYHFSALEGVHYERLPYRNHKTLQEGAKHVTRFIALGKVNNRSKKKYLYAFNLVPMKHMDPTELLKQPTDVTECPYDLDTQLPKLQAADATSQYFYDPAALERGQQQGKKRQVEGQGGQQRKKQPAQPSGPCWFCLSSPEVEKHLVVSVGTESYVALAKGGLTSEHSLICSIGHHQSTVSAPAAVLQEIDKYKVALKKCCASQGKAVVFFERNFKTQHLQIQCVPVPMELAADVKDTFIGLGLCQGIELAEIPEHSDLKQIISDAAPYFYAELPAGEKLLYRIQKTFPLQFGREALADTSLLNIPEKVDWRSCKYSKDKESQMGADFRKCFQAFDFNLL